MGTNLTLDNSEISLQPYCRNTLNMIVTSHLRSYRLKVTTSAETSVTCQTVELCGHFLVHIDTDVLDSVVR